MAVLTPAGNIHGTGSIPPIETGFGGGNSGDEHPQRQRPHLYHLGIVVGIASIAMFFGALALVYALILNKHGQTGQHVRIPVLLWVSTAAILASSFSLERVRYALRRGLVVRTIARLRMTLVLGNAFLLSQMVAWWDLSRQGVYLERNPQGSMFYVFTGLHGLHLAGGILWLVYLLRRAMQLGLAESELRQMRFSTGAAAIYWHFMGVLWLFLFFLLLIWS